jgi:hypothetical protein
MVMKRKFWYGGLVVAALVGAGAVVSAQSLHMWNSGDTLTATDLNGNFMALDQRIAALEANSQGATYPAVLGQGNGEWFCGTPPGSLNLSAIPPVAGTVSFSDAFGKLIYTNAGAIGINLSAIASSCSTSNVCSGPVTFFLKAPAAPATQTFTVHTYLDQGGAVYLNGVVVAGAAPGNPATPLGGNPNSTMISVQANQAFALSFIACSTDGPSIAFNIIDQFITANSFTVDYDRTFHRNGN